MVVETVVMSIRLELSDPLAFYEAQQKYCALNVFLVVVIMISNVLLVAIVVLFIWCTEAM